MALLCAQAPLALRPSGSLLQRRPQAAVLPCSAAAACMGTRPIASSNKRLTAAAPLLAAAAAQRRAALLPARAGGAPDPGQQPAAPEGDSSNLISSVGLFLLWGALAGWAFLLSPNQTPLRDSYFLEKLVGLGVDDGVPLNVIVQQLFLIMGVWPLVYTALLIPSGKSANGVPAWPFVTLSYAFGAFGLLPFMALWQAPRDPPTVPASAESLQGAGNLMQKGMESPVVAALCLLGSLACLGQAAVAGAAQWEAYFKLLEESRFISVMSVDFLTLTTLAPFWMYNDASLRHWEGKDSLLPLLSVLPVVGPAVYLCLRPRAKL